MTNRRVKSRGMKRRGGRVVQSRQISGVTFLVFDRPEPRVAITGRPGPSQIRGSLVFRMTLSTPEADRMVADLATSVGYQVVTPVADPPRARICFPVDASGNVYMKLELCHDHPEFATVTVPVRREQATALLHNLADPLEWDLFED